MYYMSKELKYVKNGLFWCIPAFYVIKLSICVRN
ncbi:hypothetical protein E2C01_032213 [Portunus trituberculatus]|uniref:Uncharacterized protein n=1 Tax=Portunus trituberculatus TaxID=210409 RepID=A0A5B7EVF9_PORTR|nr:hypothetical protein [Portunus trituberculatus]